MSAYVVTQTGVVIEYPRAGCIKWINETNFYAELHIADNGGFICKVPRGCVVSFDRPTSIQQAQNAMRTSLADSLELVTACIESIDLNWTNKQRLKALKKSLSRFDTRSVIAKVEMPAGDPREDAFGVQLENGWWTSDGMETSSFCAGSFRYRDDILALLELLARGWHG